MKTDSTEFENVREARDNLAVRVKDDPDWISWFRGVGIGFTADNRWQLVAHVRDHKDIPNVEMLLRAIGYTGPYDLSAIGDITAATGK